MKNPYRLILSVLLVISLVSFNLGVLAEPVETVVDNVIVEPSYFQDMFSKLLKLSPTVVGIVAVLAIGGLLGFIIMHEKKNTWTPKMLTVGAMCIAISFILSQIRLFRMPQGGSITPASGLPLLLFAYAFGVAPGAVVCIGAGLLQLLQGGDILHPIQVVLDYPLAFGVYCLAGIFTYTKLRAGLQAGILVGMLGRFVCAVVSGAVFFGVWAPENVNPWVYSLSYNATYLSVETVIMLVVSSIPGVFYSFDKSKEQNAQDKLHPLE